MIPHLKCSITRFFFLFLFFIHSTLQTVRGAAKISLIQDLKYLHMTKEKENTEKKN